MTVTVYEAGQAVHLSDKHLLGVGGEGRVYAHGARAYKVYFTPTKARADKLRAFPSRLPAPVVAPEAICEDRRGSVVGYAMRRVQGAVDFYKVSQRAWREGTLSNAALVDVLREMDDTVRGLHARGVVVGDLNDGNVVVAPGSDGALAPWFIDADSLQLPGHPCTVAHERFLDPRLYGTDLDKTAALSRESDFYALAVLAFSALLYVHPFGGAHPTLRTMLRRAEARHSVLRADVTAPRVAARPAVLPDDALEWFRKVFEGDLREPLPAALLSARFTACSCGVEHARVACPSCTASAPVRAPSVARGTLRVRSVVRAEGGAIVDASFDGRLRYVVRRGDGHVRDDGRTIDLGASPAWVKVVGATTWVAEGARVRQLGPGATAGDVLVGAAPGELAADAGARGLVYADGAWLVRASDGTRLGQVLEGQTHVRVGDAVGLAFYRAGELTVWFVFDPSSGPLRQIALPPLRGRLTDFSVVLGGALALFTAQTVKDGKIEITAHLVDARGNILATESGPLGSSPLLYGVHGRAVAHGAVITATPDGLALCRPDAQRRSFDLARVFSDAAGVVGPESRLLVGEGGSLYAVDHDEIRHVTFNP
ncbi:MAG: hypothetical protein R3B36_04150 [Polyangiaceae bacterium]